MKKKLMMAVTTICAAVLLVSTVNAQNLDNGKEANLRKCIKNTTDGVCTLIDNITVKNDDIRIDKDSAGTDITIDLNGHTITLKNDNELWVDNGRNVTFKNGTIIQESDGYSAIVVIYGNVTTSNLTVNVTANPDEDDAPSAFWLEGKNMNKGASLTVSADTTVIAPNGRGIGVAQGGLPIDATINGTWQTKYPIVSGAEDPEDDSTFNQANFTFEGGSYTTDDATVSIYKKGNWTINDGTFTSKNDSVIKVIDPTDGAISLQIKNGVFETEAADKKTIDAGSLENFVSGGKFIANKVEDELPAEYIAEGYDSFVTEDGATVIGHRYNITVSESKNGTVTTDKDSAVSGQKVTLIVKAKDGYELDTITVTDTEGNVITVDNNSFIMPESDVTVTATFKKSAQAVKNPDTSDINITMLFTMIALGVCGLGLTAKKRLS